MKNLGYALLLDVYGSMLTEKQRNVMELYYWEDLSLGEISQSEGVTRQAVRDSIKRSEQILNDFEEKLCLAKKIKKCRDSFEEIYILAEKNENNETDKLGIIKKLAKDGLDIF